MLRSVLTVGVVAVAFGLAPAAVPLRTAATVPAASSLLRVPHVALPRKSVQLRMAAVEPVPEVVEAVEEVAAPAEPEVGAAMAAFNKFSDVFSNLFPLWTLLVAGTGLFYPSVLSGIPTSYFTGLLGLLMLSMGITLTIDDFKRVLTKPGVMVLGFIGCYGFMPALALGLARGMGLSAAMTAGMVLVGSINGGQASNLCTYIAKGDVALSVLMTTVTTIGAIFMTPLLSKLLLGAIVPVDAVGVAISTIQVVLVPIVVGMLTNAKFPKFVKKVEPFSPVVGVLCTCILVGSAVAQCAGPILAAGLSLQVAAALLHILGGVVAYLGCKPAGYDEQTCRTVAIETSMKSSAFGFLLAKLHFKDALVRVVPAVSVVWMALVGSSLAVAFRFLPVADAKK